MKHSFSWLKEWSSIIPATLSLTVSVSCSKQSIQQHKQAIFEVFQDNRAHVLLPATCFCIV